MAFSILIVDDHEQFRAMLSTVFQRAGLAAREAQDGPSAIAAFEAEPCDLVLMDQSMPGMKGVDAAKALRARSSTVRIVLISGHKREALNAEARAAGVDLVLTKPISPRALMEAINALMQSDANMERGRPRPR
ncbi:MAG: response regulator [Terricaulis sp.]|nr:response regulator [Terricaulis sp.]